MKKENYNFEIEIFKQPLQETQLGDDSSGNTVKEPRPNLKIVKCCGNCKHYWYDTGNQRLGFCRIAGPHFPNPHKKPELKVLAKSQWLKSYITNICDNHNLRHEAYSKKTVETHTGLNFEVSDIIDPRPKN